MLDAEPEEIIRLFIEYFELNKYLRPREKVLTPQLIQFRGFERFDRAVRIMLRWLSICRQNNNEKEVWRHEAEELSIAKQLVRLVPQLAQVAHIADLQTPRRVDGGGPDDLIIAKFSINPTLPPERWEVIKRLLAEDYRPTFEKQCGDY